MRQRTTAATATAAATLAAVFAATVGGGGQQPQPRDPLDHFKYGAVGTEVTVGLPYPVFRALPILCEDKLPKRPGRGYEKLGFLYESPQAGRPVGTTYSSDKTPLVGLNCATCHAGSYREAPGAPRRIVLGMPAHQIDLQGYARFLTACAQDSRFTASALVDAIRKDNPDFGWFEGLLYRFVVFDRVKKGILERAEVNSWFDSRPPQGPGRVDTFNPYKRMLGLDLVKDTAVGTVDLPSLWQQRVRQGLWLHWDGNNNSVEERNKSAAIGAGATPESLDLAALKRVEEWILDLAPPPYPAGRIDQARATAGRAVYDTACASCHAIGGARVGQVTPLAEVGTDPERLHSFTAQLAERMNTIGQGRPWKFSHFRKTEGYANMPLDGLWLRAPYLHNGSVPTLRALLFPEERPAEFYRAYDVIDWADVGFVWRGADAEQNGVKFDTRERGNGNGGHLYGQELSRDDREALLEYLKTL